ncbi:hypothetical protein ACWDX6_27675 [Streptomyces sp. NPDC003027]
MVDDDGAPLPAYAVPATQLKPWTGAPGSASPDRTAHAGRPDRPRHESQLQQITADALAEVSFQDHGRRAQGLMIEYTDVDHIEFDR